MHAVKDTFTAGSWQGLPSNNFVSGLYCKDNKSVLCVIPQYYSVYSRLCFYLPDTCLHFESEYGVFLMHGILF